MTPYWADDTVILHLGKAEHTLLDLPDASVDAIVTDPPYELNFMGRTWDASGIAYDPAMWAECLRVLKPGGHMVAFGGTRTYHRMVCAIEDAGFEVRDSMHWIYGSGFPKSLSVHKATLSKVNSRYGPTKRCNCLDAGNGRSARNDAGQGGSAPVRDTGEPGEVPSPEIGHWDVPRNARAGDHAVRELWRAGDPSQQGDEAFEASVLLADVRECGTEAPGHGHAPVRAGLEEHPGEGASARPELPSMWSASDGAGPARPSPEAVPVWRDEPSVEPGGLVRLVSPHDRGGYDEHAGVDPDRSQARRVHPDDLAGRRDPVARVCSWCGLPDRGWLDDLAALGSALKPAHEPIVLARRPLGGTVAANVLTHGTGALNIDGCRVGSDGGTRGATAGPQGEVYGDGLNGAFGKPVPGLGRWPTNVVLSHPPLLDDTGQPIGDACADGCVPGCPVAELDRQSGKSRSSGSPDHPAKPATGPAPNGAGWGMTAQGSLYSDEGGASRFFPVFRYEAKAPTSERPRLADGTAHATVKPLTLMRWLVRLVTPPAGLVLDPFAGSGTTAEACVIEGFRALLIEQDPGHAELIKARLSKPLQPALGFEEPA